jgi:prophage antirepressor-like protein
MINPSLSTFAIPPFSFNFNPVRVALHRDEPWFVAKDVMKALEYAKSSNPDKVFEHVPSKWKRENRVPTPRGSQKLLTLSEQGLCFFLGHSDKPQALPFQKWLTSQVLPSIRKTGPLIPDLFAERYPSFSPDAFMQVHTFVHSARQLAQKHGVTLPGSEKPEIGMLADLLIHTCLQQRWMLGFDSSGRMTLNALAAREMTVNLESINDLKNFILAIPANSIPLTFQMMGERITCMLTRQGTAAALATTA